MNAKSLSFLRPIFHTLSKTNDLVLLRCCFSRMAGHTEIHLIETEYQLKLLLRRLPAKTIIEWKPFKYPDFSGCVKGLIPTKEGTLEYGAY